MVKMPISLLVVASAQAMEDTLVHTLLTQEEIPMHTYSKDISRLLAQYVLHEHPVVAALLSVPSITLAGHVDNISSAQCGSESTVLTASDDYPRGAEASLKKERVGTYNV